MRIYTKDELIAKLLAIRSQGWIINARPGNVGGIGNTLEDLLGIDENNLPLPNAAEWELKCQRKDTSSLTTLFHMEPSPRAIRFVPNLLLPKYGWPHKSIPKEQSFRQTINGLKSTDRGFRIVVDWASRRVLVSFDASKVDPSHAAWLKKVASRVGLGELQPQPYWGFDDLTHKAATKLLNCFYIRALVRHERGEELFLYQDIMILQRFSADKFLRAIEQGFILVDFDARTGHNHGTKFRLRQDHLPDLYDDVQNL
ncbi:MAG: MvaI/BcnI family restriction endonuclease [Candidatus Sumerlaeia bacterium]|nr:MvaI/BcnI family restriction endonuclease [Candidatus Sumerlaeia bacterium]